MISKHLANFTAALLLSLIGACGALDVSDPTAIEDSDVANATGADLLRRDAVARLYVAVSEGALRSGLLTDELMWDALDMSYPEDPRSPTEDDQLAHYGLWQDVRRAATLTIPVLRASGATASSNAHIAEMFAARGFANLRLAEYFCPGFPLHDIIDFEPVYGAPLSTEEVFEHSLADFDSAVAYGGDSARVDNLARVGRAQALLGLGAFNEAAASAGAVPTEHAWSGEYGDPFQYNLIGFFAEPVSALGLTVGDTEGGNGLGFRTEDDPRVETFQMETSQGELHHTYGAIKYPNRSAPIVISSGVEARLIEAEAALRGGGDWLRILNALRTDGTQSEGIWNQGTGGVAGLAPLDDPGADSVRLDILFRERAFWLFGTGHRLGDLRRLITHYGRQSEDVFPTGVYAGGAGGQAGALYGSAISFPFPALSEKPFSPGVTGCTGQ